MEISKKPLVKSSVKNDIGSLIIDSNDQNTLTRDTLLELGDKFGLLEANPEVKVIVITGYPKSFFSAGADVKEIAELVKSGDKVQTDEVLKTLQAILFKIENSSKPVVAAINGYCLGGGLELALACKYRIANRDAMLGFPEIDLGIIPGLGGTQRLPRLIGPVGGLRMLLGGKKAIVSSRIAKDLGLVDFVAEGDFVQGIKSFITDLLTGKQVRQCSMVSLGHADSYIDEKLKTLISDKVPSAVEAVKRAYNEGSHLLLQDALATEQAIFIEQAFSPDGIEGVTAYIEKRASRFGESKVEKMPVQRESSPTGDLSEEHAMLRQTVKEFAENEIRPKVNEMEADGNIFPDIIGKMADLGLFGVPFPDEYGGAGLGKTGYCILMEEICRIHGSMAVFVGASVGLTGGSIALYGSEAQKQKYLRAIAEGKAIGAFALTEAEAGSDVAGLSSTAEKRGNRWIINGTKQFISNGDIADTIVIFAKTDRNAGQDGITAFIIEKNYSGFKTTKVEHKIGIKASRTTSMEFTDMEVPEENMLGPLDRGFKVAMKTLNYGRLSLAAACLGASKRAFELAYSHVCQRSQMGKKLWEFQITQSKLARMRAEIFLMEKSVYAVAAKADSGGDIRLESAIVKLTASEMSEKIIRESFQIQGGGAFMAEAEIARMYLDAPINTIFEGTNEIQQLLIFKEIFKSGGKI